MNLHEYQAKELLLKFELPLLKGKSYVNTLDGIENDLNNLKGPPWVVKSQIHAGGRGAGYFKNAFNMIFCDPPYKDANIKKIVYLIYKKKLLKKNGIIILHRNKKTVDILPKFFDIIEIRNYGISKIIFGKFLS